MRRAKCLGKQISSPSRKCRTIASISTASSASASARARCSPSPAWWRSRRPIARRRISILTGRYILQPEILEILGTQERGAGGEIQLTDAMIQLARKQPFYGLQFDGRSFDCGSKIGFLAANVSYALERPDIAPGFRAEINKILGELNGGKS